MEQDPAVGQGESFARRTAGEQHRAHGRRLTEGDGGDIGFDVLHGVVDGETGGDGATRAC